MSAMLLLILRFGMALALYAFLGWIGVILWRDLKHQRKLVEGQQLPSMKLEVQVGNEYFTQQYNGTQISIGRGPTCDCSLDSETVSVLHAQLTFHHNQWWVEDLQSTNGTLLNGELVRQPTVVANGDQLQCGEVQLTLQFPG